MASHEITSAPDEQPEDKVRDFLPQADDPYAPGDLPHELLEFHSPSAALVNMPATPSAQYITWMVSALVFSSIVVMSVFPLDQVVTTPGRLIATDATLVVQPLETSIIHSIDVKEGELVHKGQVLAHLDPTVTDADVTNLQLQKESYQAERDRLLAEAEGKDYKLDPQNPSSAEQEAAFLRRKAEYTAKVGDYESQIAALSAELQSATASAEMYKSRARVAGDVYKMRSHLQKELVGSKLSTLGAQDQLMEMERSQIAAEHQASQDRNQIAALSHQRDAYVENWKAEVYQDLSQAEHQLAEAVAEYDKAHLRKSLVVLTASRDAVVLTIAKLSSGSVISTASELMTLVPVDSGLEVEATLTGANAGFVKLGDPAILKFETFPFPQYGGAEGTVREISPDSFSGPDTPVSNAGASATQAPDPMGNYQSFYRVRLKVDRYTLHGVPSYFHPRPGMPVTADIKVGKRTIMQFILNRMLPMLTSGMRQPG